MLSKSQARLFFLGGTAVFTAVFLGLTVDTMSQVGARTHESNMSPAVVRGRTIWDHNNCMGCHTLLGEGAYYAPELTKVVERRGEAWLAVFLKDPEAMFPGRRKMVNYHFNDEQIRDVIAFLGWVGRIDTNGFPAKPDLAPQAPAAPPTVAAPSPPGTGTMRPVMVDQICIACHAQGGRGGLVGPALDGVGNRYTPEKLDQWLKDPQSVKPGTQMPNLSLDDQTRADLVAWLMSLK